MPTKRPSYGYQAGPENFGYLMPTVVAETEEKAQEIANNFVFGGGQNAFAAPEFTMPPGYNSKSAIRDAGQADDRQLARRKRRQVEAVGERRRGSGGRLR